MSMQLLQHDRECVVLVVGAAAFSIYCAVREPPRVRGQDPSHAQNIANCNAGELRDDVTFATRADVDTVVELYERSFVRAFDTYRQHTASAVLYDSLGWGTAEVPTLVAALEYAEAHCRPKDAEGKEDAKLTLSLRRNEFTAAEEAQLRAAIPGGSTKFEVWTG